MNSWDLFDTLIARRWVDSSWIWAAMEQHTAIAGFAQKRRELARILHEACYYERR